MFGFAVNFAKVKLLVGRFDPAGAVSVPPLFPTFVPRGIACAAGSLARTGRAKGYGKGTGKGYGKGGGKGYQGGYEPEPISVRPKPAVRPAEAEVFCAGKDSPRGASRVARAWKCGGPGGGLFQAPRPCLNEPPHSVC